MNLLRSADLGQPGETTGIRPEHLHIRQGGAIPGVVSHVEKLGAETLVYVRHPSHGLVTVRLFGEHDYSVDSAVALDMESARAFHFDSAGRRIRHPLR